MTTTSSNFTGLLNRILIIFLLFTLMVTAGSFILRHRINQRLEKLGRQLEPPTRQHEISALLVDLDVAENRFQKAGTDGNPEDLAAYQQGLDTIFLRIKAIVAGYQKSADHELPGSQNQLERGLQQKLKLSERLFSLRRNFDSLLRVTTFANMHRAADRVGAGPEQVKIDSIVSTRQEESKTGLFSRLKEALKAKQSVKVVTVREHKQVKAAVNVADARRLLALLGTEYSRMSQSGQALVLANLNLLTNLRGLIRQLQDIDQQAFERSRSNTLKAYALATRDLNTFSGVALVAVLVFVVLLLIYIRRAGFAELRLRVESNRAIKLASQKSEILAIMSHEIRNKLMAINGAVFTMKRTQLTPQQEQKLSAINLASGLVLETVNNVLDVSKMEQGYADSRKSGPFAPQNAITNAVEAMRFMAENKNIKLDLSLSGDADVTVTGDEFRLKQILLNLLSNAIKYTEEGGITVTAAINKVAEQYRLAVEVKDTGVGIAKNVQEKLFTPYYQVAGGKPGTGLGLYLCRQLVLKEGGDIKLESDAGKGTTISFNIPYKTGNMDLDE